MIMPSGSVVGVDEQRFRLSCIDPNLASHSANRWFVYPPHFHLLSCKSYPRPVYTMHFRNDSLPE